VTRQDVILHIGEQEWRPSCQQVHISGFNRSPNAELVCRYSDITYFLEGSVTKIFLEADYIFANGSFLAKKGSLNLVLLAEYYRIPVVGCGGSWNYNGWAPISESALLDHYGSAALADYDWIEPKYLKSLILEVGPINPKQLSAFPPIIYKDLRLAEIEW
jgi:translation initiation factor 2B subunit (eIF-2B alpha/beta/delta family)